MTCFWAVKWIAHRKSQRSGGVSLSICCTQHHVWDLHEAKRERFGGQIWRKREHYLPTKWISAVAQSALCHWCNKNSERALKGRGVEKPGDGEEREWVSECKMGCSPAFFLFSRFLLFQTLMQQVYNLSPIPAYPSWKVSQSLSQAGVLFSQLYCPKIPHYTFNSTSSKY